MNHDARVALLHVAATLVACFLLWGGCSRGAPVSDCRPTSESQTTAVSALLARENGGSQDGSAAQLLERCQSARNECLPLCQRALEPGAGALAITTCELVLIDGGFGVHVVYAPPCPL